MLELTLRLVFSLAVVVGLLLLLARFGAKRFSGGAGSLVHVVHRQALSRTSAVTVVTVGSKVLVLGSTEQSVTVLTELDPEELVTEEQVSQALTSEGNTKPAPIATGVLSGSLLSPATWKQTLAAFSQTSRKAS